MLKRPIVAIETKALVGHDSEAKSTIEDSLYATPIWIQTMPCRPTIDKASLTLGVVVVDNTRGSLQNVGLEGQIFTLWMMLLDSGGQQLMLSK